MSGPWLTAIIAFLAAIVSLGAWWAGEKGRIPGDYGANMALIMLAIALLSVADAVTVGPPLTWTLQGLATVTLAAAVWRIGGALRARLSAMPRIPPKQH